MNNTRNIFDVFFRVIKMLCSQVLNKYKNFKLLVCLSYTNYKRNINNENEKILRYFGWK